jgi:signal peptidase I
MSSSSLCDIQCRAFRTLLLAALVTTLLSGYRANRVDAGEASTPVGETQAVAYAYTVNLRPADVRRFMGSRVLVRPAKYGPLGAAGERCAGGEAQPGDVFGVGSQRFSFSRSHRSQSLLKEEEVHSGVYLFPNSVLAAREVTVLTSARARSCLRRIAERPVSIGARPEPAFAHVKVSALPSPLKAFPARGIRITATEGSVWLSPHTRDHPEYYADLFFFSMGPIVITFIANGSSHHFSTATERRLLALLYRRAKISISSTPQLAGEQVYRVPSQSMEPTLLLGSSVIIKAGPPAIGSIVVFHPPVGAEVEQCGVAGQGRRTSTPCSQGPPQENTRIRFIKRVVAGPGDEIYIRAGHVYRKAAGSNSFIRESDPYIRRCGLGTECNFPQPIKIPAGEWFVMGDNRGESDDSRYYGPIPTAWIVGTAID